ncbi:hypothetical protein [Sulfitobacter sp.]|uniref:hypothetical protein n=1 Tax=Sulfitobacter sp. TaxID=1903071 RepID=UPI0030029DB4
MALNIPVNLMSTIAPPTQAQSASNTAETGGDTNTIQPVAKSGNTRGASTGSDSNAGYGTAYHKASIPKPEGAEPKSVVSAQAQAASGNQIDTAKETDIARTKALIASVAAAPATLNELADRPNKVDRYAPPDPLPTAPILKTPAPKPFRTSPD